MALGVICISEVSSCYTGITDGMEWKIMKVE